MSQNGEEANAQPAQPVQQAQNLNQISVLTIAVVNGTIYIVSIASPDRKTQLFGNRIGIIVPYNRITKGGSNETPESHRKQYTLRFENGVWNVYLSESRVHTFDEIFGLQDGITHLENVSFQQFKYVPTADDEITASFRYMIMKICNLNPNRFCLEDSKKKMEVCVGGMKVRIPISVFDVVKQHLNRLGVSMCSFVKHLDNGSKIGVCRGDMDFYVRDAKQAELIIDILTELGFVKGSTAKSNDYTFRLYLDVLCQIFSDEAIMSEFNLPEGSDLAQYYIEVEIKIATEFQKAYESNCLGYFLGLLLSHFLKISISGVWLKHGCGEISLNVASFDDFLKKLGINLDGIRTTSKFIERLLASPLISELLTVDNILRLYKNIMGDEKMKHTSKPLREWLHLLLCGLKARFPDRFSSLRSELVQEMVRDEKNDQIIPVWRVRLFVLNQGSENEIQMEKGVLSISVSEKKLFVSTGTDETSLILSEEQLKSDSRKQAFSDKIASCLGGSTIINLLKAYFDYLKEINLKDRIIEKIIEALGCHSEVSSYLRDVHSKLMEKISKHLMDPLYSVRHKKSVLMKDLEYGDLIFNLVRFKVSFLQFEEFCVQKRVFVDNYNDFVFGILNNIIFYDYLSKINALPHNLSPEASTQKRGEIYADAMRNIEKLCLELVEKWILFQNSELFWRTDTKTGFFHIPSGTSHEMTSGSFPYYLGTSVLGEEDSSVSSKSKGKKTQKGKSEGEPVPEEKPQGNPVPEEKPQGKPVHVFMNGQSGEIFTVPIAK